MQPTPTQRAFRHIRNTKAGGSGCAAYLFAILAFVVGFFSLASGLNLIGLCLAVLLLGIAAACEPKSHKTHFCGHCGNEVAPTSVLCPHCHTALTPAPKKFRLHPIFTAVILFAILVGLFFLWIHNR